VRSGTPARQQPPDLVEQARFELLVHASRSRSASAPWWQAQRDGHHLHVRAERRHGVGEVRRQRLAGLEVHLERADDPLAIPRLDALGRRRIDARSRRAGAPRRSAGQPIQPGAQRRIVLAGARERGRASARGSRTPSRRRGSAPAARVNLPIAPRRVAREVRRVVLGRRRHDVDEVMGMPRRSDTGTLSVPMSKPR
jgi:hypothetical protein